MLPLLAIQKIIEKANDVFIMTDTKLVEVEMNRANYKCYYSETKYGDKQSQTEMIYDFIEKIGRQNISSVEGNFIIIQHKPINKTKKI